MKLKQFLLSLGIVTFLLSCSSDDDVVVPNQEELITTLTYTLTPQNGGDPVVLSFQDLDGDGSGAPVVTNGTIQNGIVYNGAIVLLNETEDPAENITLEIQEEELDHQFFFQSNINGLTVNYTDTDSEGNPIGLASTLTAPNAGTGTLTVTLRHEPNKSGTGVSDGDITNAGGETDIEVTFELEVQ